MIKKVGFCDNKGHCEMADGKKPIELEGTNPVCPRCGNDLEGDKSIPWKPIIFLAIALLIMLPSAFFAFKWLFPNSPVNTETNPITVLLPPSTPNTPVLCEGEINKGVLNKIMEKKFIIMGVEFDSAPINTSPIYETTDDYDSFKPQKDNTKEELKRRKNELDRPRIGFDYEVAKMIADYLELKGNHSVKTREVGSFGDLFCLLNRKEPDNGEFSVDMIMSGIVEDPKYNATIDWSKSYATFNYALITSRSSKFDKISDFQNKTIGIIENDSSVEAYIKKELPDAKIVKYDDSEWKWTDCAINGHDCEIDANEKLPRVDACIYDFPFAKEEMSKVSPLKGQLLEILDANLPNSVREYRIGVAKGNNDLMEKLNEAIKYITTDSQARLLYQDLVIKYMTPKKGSVKKLEQEAGDEIYTVQKGDTLSEIARKLLNDYQRWQELQKKNNIGNEYLIQPGQKIYYTPVKKEN